jgi:hypothetical protein
MAFRLPWLCLFTQNKTATLIVRNFSIAVSQVAVQEQTLFLVTARFFSV